MVLAGLDGALFLAALRLLSIEQHCSICYFNSLVSLNVARAATLAAIFVLLCASVGIYNADALRSFRTFAKRFALAWQLIFVLAVGFFAITKIGGRAAVRLVRRHPVDRHHHIHDRCCSTVRFFFHLYYRSPFLKKRVLVLGQGGKADAAVDLYERPGPQPSQTCPHDRQWPDR